MFGLGIWEIALILAVALVVLGPQRLPAVAKQLGRGLRELRRAASDFQVTLEQEADAEEMRQRRTNLPQLASNPPGTVPSPVGEPIEDEVESASEVAEKPSPAQELSAEPESDASSESAPASDPEPTSEEKK